MSDTSKPTVPEFDSAPSFTDTLDLRREVIATCLKIVDLGYFLGTWGNISVRLKEGLLVTPSRMDYQVIQPDDLVVVSWEGTKLKGNRVPTSETELHRLLCLRRPDLGAIIHAHSPYASTLAVAHQTLPVCVEDLSQIIGGEVRCSRYVPAGRHRAFAEAAGDAIGEESSAVLLANHGVAAGGRCLAEALVALQILEKGAQMHLLAASIGGSQCISPDLVNEERHRYLYKYGKEDLPVAQN